MWHLLAHWSFNIMIAANQFVNAATGGDPQMSMSARAGFARQHGSRVGRSVCAVAEFFDIHHPNPKYDPSWDHCDIAIVDYVDRKETIQWPDSL